MAKKARLDTSDAMLALHLNESCDTSCAYCVIDRAAEVLAESKKRHAPDDGRLPHSEGR